MNEVKIVCWEEEAGIVGYNTVIENTLCFAEDKNSLKIKILQMLKDIFEHMKEKSIEISSYGTADGIGSYTKKDLSDVIKLMEDPKTKWVFANISKEIDEAGISRE